MTDALTECGCVDSCLHKPNCVFETPATREIATLRAKLASARKALEEIEEKLLTGSSVNHVARIAHRALTDEKGK